MTGLHFTAVGSEAAQRALATAVAMHGQTPLEGADAVIAIGGDGFMLSVLGQLLHSRTDRRAAAVPGGNGRRQTVTPPPVYGVNYGTRGFLLNGAAAVDEEHLACLPDRVATALRVPLVPLRVDATLHDGTTWTRWAVNDVVVRRRGPQAAVLRLDVDGTCRLPRLAGDGVLVSTAAGSAAYNASAGGPILPLSSRALALTPICPITPRRWPGAVLPAHACVDVVVEQADKRPVEVTADIDVTGEVTSARICQDPDAAVVALFDSGQDLDDKLLEVQFPTG